MVAGQDMDAVDVDAGEEPGPGTGGQYHRSSGAEDGVADLDPPGVQQCAVAGYDRDALGRDQPLQASVQRADHPCLVGPQCTDVDALEGGVDAVLAAVAGQVGDLGGTQHRLGRDAPAVQAGAADLVAFDDGDGETEVGGAQNARVPAAAPADDDDVVAGFHGQSLST